MPLPPPAPLPESTAQQFAVAPIFGGVAGDTAGEPVPALGAVTPQGDLRLLGVIAGRDGAGQALFRVADRGPVLVGVGAGEWRRTAPRGGVGRRVRLSGRGEVREMLLRAAPPLASPVVVAPAKLAAVDRGACAAPAGFKGSLYRINAELLSGMAAQPDSWKPWLAASAAGLVVREGSGFASMLGLKSGDRLREANGIPLTATDDLLVAVVKPLQGNQPVRVRAAREGGELELLLVNASACTPR
ncbi:MAG: hypothetical protein IPI40_10450 [Betaproteobacteria bacterium]|nr:hypothetical protein [Betaproteobacteria bacterium]